MGELEQLAMTADCKSSETRMLEDDLPLIKMPGTLATYVIKELTSYPHLLVLLCRARRRIHPLPAGGCKHK